MRMQQSFAEQSVVVPTLFGAEGGGAASDGAKVRQPASRIALETGL